LAYTHEPGYQPPDGKKLVKSSYSRSEAGIALFVEAVKLLALEFQKKYGSPPN
jgi:hypothetical protein